VAVKHFGLRESCGRHCSRESGHDPRTHERYGQQRALAHVGSPLPAVVQVGPLTVNIARNQITVDGEEPPLTRIQSEVLQVLAESCGRTYRHRELVERIWGPIQAELWCHRSARHGAWHGLRIHVHRLRQRLGPAGTLIENVPDRGYRLRVEPA
jgi:DNA-binding response OmpR family regulator